MRSPASSRPIAAMSSSLSSKSKSSKFSRIRSRRHRLRDDDVAELQVPAQDRLGRRPARGGRRSSRSSASSSSSPWASGLQASVAIPWSACQARSSACWRRGCSSIWFTVGSSSASALQPLEVLDPEVGDADRACPALLVDPFEGTPGVEVAVLGRHRPVDQVEVDVVECRAVRGSSRRRAGSSRSPAGSSRAWW